MLDINFLLLVHEMHSGWQSEFIECSCILLLRELKEVLTAPRSRMKQSPLLKLDQLRGTWVALTTRRPLMCSSRSAEMSLVTTWWKPEATPPVWGAEETVSSKASQLLFTLHPLSAVFCTMTRSNWTGQAQGSSGNLTVCYCCSNSLLDHNLHSKPLACAMRAQIDINGISVRGC